jgi:TIR domain
VLVFLSYARADKQLVRPLVEGLRLLGHSVWLDEEITGGQAWWNIILRAIRDADTVVAAVSERALDSQACVRERSYASALGKPILPVVIEPMAPDLLPSELAELQFVEYSRPDASAALRLAAAIASIHPVPLPEVLPPPPSAPFSNLSDLSQRVHADSLNLDEQYALVARLRAALRRSEDRVAAAAILKRLQARYDLFAVVAKEIDDLGSLLADLAGKPEPEPEAAVQAPPVAAPTETAGQKAITDKIYTTIGMMAPIKGLTVAPKISSWRQSKVTNAFDLESGEAILGIFDLTMFDTGGIFMALTDRRFLYKNGKDQLSISYQDISPDQISLTEEKNDILIFGKSHYWNWVDYRPSLALLKAVAEAARA